ncbi:hypothetical protein B0A55_06919 [Friedmanniomyces simplex]|uniref:Heterokaryon incompatibility domain-containing protein n=1 Tax=Friedmanniomyces simplex TaxID=329884 RepID=A0A4U0X5S8_9PEZI|nr:hypothetical protein B0A55_06919 [Friedmanniomyces simplex]
MASTADNVVSPPRYDYAPLHGDEIRVLYLEPAETLQDPVRCRIETLSLSQCRGGDQYRTLSYAWGPTYADGSHFAHTISCDGKQMLITTSLLEALRRLREAMHRNRPDYDNSLFVPRPPTQWLWIDAVCINQQDMAERAEQVSRMADIYRRSECLEVWLGEFSSDPAEEALELELVEVLRIGTCLPGREMDLGWAVGQFLLRPWFRRRWVVQEYRLSRDRHVRIGPHSFAFSKQAMHLLRRGLDASRVQVPPVTQSPRPLLFELYQNRLMKCSVPHDRIYALLHISSDMNAVIPIDYTNPVEDLFIAVAAQQARFSGAMLQALLACASAFRGTAGLPSWVPDWRGDIDHGVVPLVEHLRAIAEVCVHPNLSIRGESESMLDGAAKVDSHSLLVRGVLLRPCFPPQHSSQGTCATCRLSGTEFWYPELKNRLMAMKAKRQVLLIINAYSGCSLAFVLEPCEQSETLLGGKAACRLGGLCFRIPWRKRVLALLPPPADVWLA